MFGNVRTIVSNCVHIIDPVIPRIVHVLLRLFTAGEGPATIMLSGGLFANHIANLPAVHGNHVRSNAGAVANSQWLDLRWRQAVFLRLRLVAKKLSEPIHDTLT